MTAGVLDHAVRIEILLYAKAVTGGQAPAGLLNENSRGSSSRIRSRKLGRRSWRRTAALPLSGVHIRHYRCTTGKLQRGFKRLARRWVRSSRTLKRSTTTSIGVSFAVPVSADRKDRRLRHQTSTDVTLACQVLQRFGVFALRSLMIGASSIRRLPSGCDSSYPPSG